MYVICHSCARCWEVTQPEAWPQGGIASCGFCGHPHTLDMCRASQTLLRPGFHRRNHSTYAEFLDALADGAAELVLLDSQQPAKE